MPIARLPLCPRCEAVMIKRRGPRGEFWGCSKFPNCRGSREVEVNNHSHQTNHTSGKEDKSSRRSTGNGKEQSQQYDPITRMSGSPEQETIWHEMTEGQTHLVVNAGPGCLVGSTLIDCPRDLDKYPAGIPIQDLVGQKPWVYGYSRKMKRIVIRKAICVWKTGDQVPVYKVTFRNAYSPAQNLKRERPPNYVIGTADHPFLLRVPPIDRHPGWNAEPPIPGGYRKLSQLKPGDRVIAFLREFDEAYTYISLNNGTKEIESRFILSEIQGSRGKEFNSHHKNERKHDHSPDNLEWKTIHDHHADHFTKNPLPGWQGTTGIHPRGMAGKKQTRKQRRVARKWGRIRAKVLHGPHGHFGYNHIVEKVEFYGYEDVYNMTVEDCHNFIANGVVTHNTGKTWSSIQGCLRMPRQTRILFVAFNRHIAREAQGKLMASNLSNVQASTYHSLGLRMIRAGHPSVRIDDGKMTSILESLSPEPTFNKADWRRMLNTAEKLCGFAKNYLLDPQQRGFHGELEKVADHHALDMNGHFAQSVSLVPEALEICRKKVDVVIDFDDMIWLPVVLGLPYSWGCDMMITDESQDLNVVQHELMFQVAGEGRMMIVGDKRQSIYGFRGAHTASLEVLTKRLAETKLGVKELPLTVTRRCPQNHVVLAHALFPECAICGTPEAEVVHTDTAHSEHHPYTPTIRALDSAPQGEVRVMPQSSAIEDMRIGDLVLCRVNAELVPAAYQLIRRGIRPSIKGRDIGQGLISLVERLEKAVAGMSIPPEEAPSGMSEMHWFSFALREYRRIEETKLSQLGRKGEGRLTALQDKCDCLVEFISNSTSIADMKSKITSLFSDEVSRDVVTLGTVHRTKGLEAERVFVLAPELIPHPMARKPWEQAQERNLAWVAATRAKFDSKTGAPGTITFCGAIPQIYGPLPDQKTTTNSGT